MPKHPPRPKGRPRKAPEDKICTYPSRFYAWMTEDQHDKLTELGGSAWIRLQIDNALEFEE